jgi:uncharacterized protein (DUF1697 family)
MRYAVFLRAINLGNHNKMPMKELRVWLEQLGYSSILTHLQTGNIWLQTKAAEPESIAQSIESMLQGQGYSKVSAMVRSEAELRGLLKVNPFSPSESGYCYVTFLRQPSALILAEHPKFELKLARAAEILSLVPKAPPGQSPFNLNTHLESKLKVASTSRYWKVVGEFLQLI